MLGLGRVGNLLVHVRCVDQADKALGMAVQEVSLALIAFIPGEVILSQYWPLIGQYFLLNTPGDVRKSCGLCLQSLGGHGPLSRL